MTVPRSSPSVLPNADADRDDVQIVRDYIEAGGYEVVWTVDEAEPERGKQPSIVPIDKEPVVAALARLVALASRAQQAETERDVVQENLLRIEARLENIDVDVDAVLLGHREANRRAEAAEARVADLEAALRQWQAVSPSHRNECQFLSSVGCTCGLQEARDLTRAALDGNEAT